MRLNIYNNRDISDIPLIGNPQITYFKSVYRRHTNFAIKRHKMNCDINQNIPIDHFGELIKSIDLEINITGNSTVVPNNLGTVLIDEIKLIVGNTEIDKLSGSYIENYMELKNPRGTKTFNITSGTNLTCIEGTMEQILSLSGGVFNPNNLNPANIDIVLPIPFSFCRDIGHALPMFLFNLNKPLYISVKTFEDKLSTDTFDNYKFIINYIYLSENEKMRFKLSKNEYLYEFIREHTIHIQNGLIEYELPPVGNIKSIMWKNTVANNYKYNIGINKSKLFNQDKSYHYFTRKTISDAGYPGGSTSNISTTFNASVTNTITTDISPHYLSINDTVVLTTTGGDLPHGLSTSTTYFVKTTPATNTLTLSTSSGGSTVTISDTGTGTHTLTSITEVIHDDSIAYYSFALKDYSKEDPLAPTGSISSNNNKIHLIINNKSGNVETITLYIKAYNIMNISDGYFHLEYLH